MYWIILFSALISLTSMYYVGYYILAILLRVNHSHYFLGYGGRPLFDFKVRGVLFSVGVFIPIFGLAKIYKIEGNAKKRADYGWQFFNKPLLTRLLVTYGGVLSLLLVAILSYVAITYTRNDRFISKTEVDKHGIYPSALAEQHGFKKGDRILTINGKEYQRFDELLDHNNYTSGSTIKILRNSQEINLEIDEINFDELRNRLFLEIMAPFEIDSVLPGSPAEDINLKKGDQIISVNGQRIVKINELQEAFDKDVDGIVSLEIKRFNINDTTFKEEVSLNDQKRLGFYSREMIEYTQREYTLFEAIAIGTKRAFLNIIYEVRMHFRIAPKNLKRVPIETQQIYGTPDNWSYAGYFLGTWAMWLVFWNFLPYPKSALWEAIALAYEGLTKKKYSYSFFNTSLTLGWVIFTAHIVWSIFNDLIMLL